MEIKCAQILYLELVLVFFGSFHLNSVITVDICKSNSYPSLTVTLDLSLSDLAQYEGNCTCDVSRINKAGNVTMDATVEIDGCDSLSLYVEGWDYQASCDEEPAYDQTQFLVLGQRHGIFMKRRLGESTPKIAGSITFKSLNEDRLSIICFDAVYVIPPPTTTATKTKILLKTTTPATSSLLTISVLGIVAGCLYGIIILLLIICLFMRYRNKKQKAKEDNQQEGVSIQNGLANGRGEQHYETLDPSASVNPIYDVMSYINHQTQDGVIYENGQSLQVQTSDCPAISVIDVDNENIQHQQSELDGCYENIVMVKDQTSHDVVLYANYVILRDQMSLDSIS